MILKHLSELYKYRELIWKLSWGEFKLRYKNSILGYFWSLLEPLLMLTVMYFVFSNLMKVQVEYYQLFLLMGIILWNFLSRSTNIGLFSIVGRPDMVKKIYFPRDIFVISSCITALLMSIFESFVFFIFMAFFRVPLSLNILYAPLILISLFTLALGVSLALSALNVYYRDVQFIWDVLMQAGFFATPILYSLDFLPETMQKIVLLNPMSRIIISARNTVIYSTPARFEDLLFMFASSILFLIIGYVVFSKLEPGFAEEI
ncbi:MAG: ABC transporter permease [Methanosarcina thermophila]|jgi:lipopolysaccharide transport system permease protein|uniref:Rhamnose-containing polysacharide translocation permease n=2 Tax=Methanosarcina thermophila TaxID=2210 RepID=A0A0E3HA28_METTE|nr:ABC transporter permease [Methanosarcina thermophila]ALK05425.1 MAG: sugar ABC transporter permease [Methanosarcina sp. 795]AKB15129.1 rhamnose-containing polysacharide translocation permease [Methanosarcina thermophila CHTI-55]NLU58314.1 ABC transporter permease [Methanosarcina thermophila]SFT81592.1 lipopolysaccharide transport system permease protein [Methanosarcina thermophila]HOA68058.1 ABC transporter permease [Methanosarcina thermophila]